MTGDRETKVVVYPGYGYRDRRGDWRVRVSGAVYEHPRELSVRSRILVRMLARAMHASPEQLDDATFQQRVAPFVASAGRGHRIWIELAGESQRLRRRSRRSGAFRGRIRLFPSALPIEGHSAPHEDRRLPIRAWLAGMPHTQGIGDIFLLARRGLSVISDIDDTIKVTDVGNRRELLSNTFLREFRWVEGMAEVYQRWSQRGASFHYVSSSPWQLFDPLSQLTQAGGFPLGTIHLRLFRLRDQFMRRAAKARRRKSRTIRQMLEALPTRRFLLIGDSSEFDAEIYLDLASRYPRQVHGVLIREVEGYPLNPWLLARHAADSGVPSAPFRTAEELSQLVEDLIGWPE